ncbi:hypothetical protein ACOMHN_045138 [Nucella lapillus]
MEIPENQSTHHITLLALIDNGSSRQAHMRLMEPVASNEDVCDSSVQSMEMWSDVVSSWDFEDKPSSRVLNFLQSRQKV